MSTSVGRSLTITYDNVLNYFSGHGDAKIHVNSYSNDQIICLALGDKSGGANLTDSAKNILFPNSTAHPTKAEMTWLVHGIVATGTAKLIINGDTVLSGNIPNGDATLTGSGSGSGVKSATKSSTISYELTKATALLGYVGCWKGSNIGPLTLYFTRYDFSAVADGVTSASVSSSTGYDGDSITFSCVIPTGYVFDGWYNGTTLVSSLQSYTHTVNGADLTLTAKAHQNTHNVNGTYNGSTKAILTGITGDVGVSYNGKTKTMPTDATEFTLGEAGKAMHTDVVVGSAAPLQCAELLMRSPLVIKYV